MKVTKEMIGAAHGICLKKGDFILSADLLERIYLAMDALANHEETWGSPVAWNGGKEGREWTTDREVAEQWMVDNPMYQSVPLYLAPPSLAQVKKQMDKLVAAALAVEKDSDEVLDFDECTAMCIPMDTYHALIEAADAVINPEKDS